MAKQKNRPVPEPSGITGPSRQELLDSCDRLKRQGDAVGVVVILLLFVLGIILIL